jgi:hypothetical protein
VPQNTTTTTEQTPSQTTNKSRVQTKNKTLIELHIHFDIQISNIESLIEA